MTSKFIIKWPVTIVSKLERLFDDGFKVQNGAGSETGTFVNSSCDI